MTIEFVIEAWRRKIAIGDVQGDVADVVISLLGDIEQTQKLPVTQHSEYEILEAMTRFGGSFVKQLAQLMRLADADNKKKKLAIAFRGYIEEYDEMANRMAE